MMILAALKAWWIGILRLAQNDLHPHPAARAVCLLTMAGLIVLDVYLFGRLRVVGASRLTQIGLLAVVILVAGWVSWLINERWRHAWF